MEPNFSVLSTRIDIVSFEGVRTQVRVRTNFQTAGRASGDSSISFKSTRVLGMNVHRVSSTYVRASSCLLIIIVRARAGSEYDCVMLLCTGRLHHVKAGCTVII